MSDYAGLIVRLRRKTVAGQPVFNTPIENEAANAIEALAARCAELEKALDPRRWDMPMQRAWHSHIPDTEAAFRALRDASLSPTDGGAHE
jgi:hypothetical protein